MGLTKLIKNRISSEWKKVFNDNVDYLNGLETKVNQKDQATNSRIDNLVLQSGGDSPNEVVDARTNGSGEKYATLRARLNAGEQLTEQELVEVNRLITGQSEQIGQLEKTIQELYGGNGGVIDIYVSADQGNDTTADGTESKPFKTIQAAINSLPLLSTTKFYIYVEPGVYLEDVVINNITSALLEIVATNNSITDAATGDTGVYVRSMAFNDCKMYCAVRGFTQTDVANSDKFIYFLGASYGAVDNCRAAQNSKDIYFYRAYNWERCVAGAIYRSYAANQYVAVSAMFCSAMRINPTLSGDGNNIVVRSEGSIVFKASSASISGTTAESKSYGGQVFTG